MKELLEAAKSFVYFVTFVNQICGKRTAIGQQHGAVKLCKPCRRDNEKLIKESERVTEYERASDDAETDIERYAEGFGVTEFHAYLPTIMGEKSLCSNTLSSAWVGVCSLNEEEAKLKGVRGVIVEFGSSEGFSTFCPEALYARVFVPVISARRLAVSLLQHADISEAANAAEKLE